MTYTNRADIYIGDVSSQVYEFLLRPRPCLFLNSHGVTSENDPNYLHWQAGPVVNDMSQFGAALREAQDHHASIYRPLQKQIFDYSFNLTDEPSSNRAARVVAEVAGCPIQERMPGLGAIGQ
jgi:CDP-glycerol glycerophosphotransferase (TagB/SpsB family)